MKTGFRETAADGQMKTDKKTGMIRPLLCFLILATAAWIAALCLLPPLERDSLIHHLAIPKLWIKAGGLVDIPWSSVSYYPMNIDLLYVIPVWLGADWAAKLIHSGFAFLTGLLIYLHVKRRLGVEWGLFACLLFLNIPIIMRLSISAYVDLGLVFFIYGAFYALILWHDTGRRRYFYLSAVSLGLALGSKYNGLLGAPILGLTVLHLSTKRGDAAGKTIGLGAIYACTTLIVFSPWLIKNYMLTGNPLFPLFNSLFGLPSLSGDMPKISLFDRRAFLYGETFWQSIATPIRAFFQGRDHSPEFFDGVLNPILLIVPPIACLKPRSWEIRPLGIFAVMWIIAVFFLSDFRIRYMTPALPALAVLTAFGLKDVWDFFSTRVKKPAAVVLFGLITTLFLAPNAMWALDYWKTLDPNAFLSGRETREEYLRRNLDHYPIMAFINSELSEDSNILFLFAGSRGYYCDRSYFYHDYYSGEILTPLMEGPADEVKICKGLKDMGATHILTREYLLRKYLKDRWPGEKAVSFVNFMRNRTRFVKEINGYSLFEINNCD